MPPRFSKLGDVLESLCAQGCDGVILAVPDRWRRFPGAHVLPALPSGVTQLHCTDLGPATKIIPVRARYPQADILYCDDDAIYGPGWAAALFGGAGLRAASCFEVARLKRRGGLVAQGFAGVRVPPEVPVPAFIPDPCRAADDLWLSAWWEANGFEVTPVPEARGAVSTFDAPGALQVQGRAQDYARAAGFISDTLGIWPEIG
ncbi:hypothetical protein ACS3SW_18365 [Roseobacteraceae bacterium S113]